MMKNKLPPLKILTATIGIAMMAACSSKQNNLPKCDSNAVKSQLLQITANNVPPNQFIQPEIMKIEQEKPETDHDLLSCRTKIAYQHKIYPAQQLIQDYAYQVNSEYQIIQLQTTQQSTDKFKNWINNLPTVVSQQPTADGTLAIIQTRKTNSNGDLIQLLVKNNQIIKLNNKADYSSITIDKRFILQNSNVYLISAYYNDARDQTIAHNFFLSVESANISISKPFMYLSGSIQIKKPDSLIFNGLYKYPFSEPDDKSIYQYSNNKITLISDSKPLSYYQQKFASYTPQQILKQIKSDGCLNGDQFYLSDICNAKISTYCFEFHALRHPETDKTFWLLKNMCQIQQY